MPFNGHELRVVELDGEPWFVAADVCRVLDMDLSAGTSRWLAGLASDEKAMATRKEHPQLFCGSFAGKMSIINESGLYRLILRSHKPEARAWRETPTIESGR